MADMLHRTDAGYAEIFLWHCAMCLQESQTMVQLMKRVLSFRVQRVICYFERKKTLKNVVVAQGNFNLGLDLCSIREIRD